MTDNSGNANISGKNENSDLKTPLDFQVNSQNISTPAIQPDSMALCFANILETFTMKQADIMGKIIGDMSEKQKESMKQFSANIDNKFNYFHESLATNSNTNKVSGNGSATISRNPNNKCSKGFATISIDPDKTSQIGGDKATISLNPVSVNSKGKNEEAIISGNPTHIPRLRKKNSQGEATNSVKPNHSHKSNDKNKHRDDDLSTDSSSDDESDDSHHHVQQQVENTKSKRKLSNDKNKGKNKKSKHNVPTEEVISLYGGSDIDDKIEKIVDGGGDSSSEENEDDECLKDIASDLSIAKKSGEAISGTLAKVINNVIYYPISEDKLTQKFQKHTMPENLEALRIKKCNYDIWADIHRKFRSRDIKTQKLQTCVLKAIGVISKASDTLIKLKNTKNIDKTNFKDSLSSVVHDCTDSIAMLSQANATIEQNRRDSIAFTMDRKYHSLRKNVPPESVELFGDDIEKRMAKINNNKRLFNNQSFSSNYYSYYDKNSKNLSRFPQNPGNQSQYGYHQQKYQKHQYKNNKHNKHSKGKRN